ncbi:MAG: CHAD domain-containing protein [Bacteroidales bacterium]|nr:CHAD domain-containing protein [Bacteroidales bacterium]
MNLNMLNRYLFNQRKTFEKCFPKIQDATDDDAIHDIRVSIKKIRTLLLLLDYIYPGEWDIREHYRPFRKIFKRLGFIRDLQVQQKLAAYLRQKCSGNLQGYQEFLEDHEKATRFNVNTWIRIYSMPDWHTLEEDIRDCYFRTGKKMIIRKANDYIEQKINQAKKISHQKDRVTIHLIRRLLKEARYMMDMIGSVFKDRTDYKLIQNKIRPIENYLGEWHDRMVALDYIFQYEKSMHTYFPHKKINTQSMIRHIIQENNSLVNKALRELNRLSTDPTRIEYSRRGGGR